MSKRKKKQKNMRRAKERARLKLVYDRLDDNKDQPKNNLAELAKLFGLNRYEHREYLKTLDRLGNNYNSIKRNFYKRRDFLMGEESSELILEALAKVFKGTFIDDFDMDDTIGDIIEDIRHCDSLEFTWNKESLAILPSYLMQNRQDLEKGFNCNIQSIIQTAIKNPVYAFRELLKQAGIRTMKVSQKHKGIRTYAVDRELMEALDFVIWADFRRSFLRNEV